MCGITGIIDLEFNPVNQSLIEKMTGTVAHRGDDDEGYTIINEKENSHYQFSGKDSNSLIKNKFAPINSASASGNIILGHRRFSIIDTSIGGHQPFFNSDSTLCTVYNGEIYNYIELKTELISKGHTFFTKSDTEVLLNAYREWGIDCFNRFNGFWALAIYDFTKKELILSRDRLGKKPLYWMKAGSTVYFGSEIKALLVVKKYLNINYGIHDDSVFNWIQFGLRDYNENTFYKDIFSLPAASFAKINNEFPQNIKQYWSLKKERLSKNDLSVKDAAATIKDMLSDSINIRLRADVPWCIELSGGMDSSSILALAARSGNNDITAYTAKFTDEGWNEEPFARSVAEKFAKNYVVIEPVFKNFWHHIKAFTYLEEEPYHSPNLQTNQIVWSMMRKYGVKVSLNGAAGDELFAGYGNYFPLSQIENLKHGNIKEFINNLSWTEGKSFAATVIPFYIILKKGGIPFISDYIKSIKEKPLSFLKNPANNNFKEHLILSDELFSDMTETKIPYWLRSGDKGYMGVPFEVRAPFLDYRLVEFAARLPFEYLVNKGWHKWILRIAMDDVLPKEINWRKRKLGFPFPLNNFLKESADIVNAIVDNSENPYLNYDQKHIFRSNWNVLSFILWYEYFINNNLDLFDRIVTLSHNADSDFSHYVPAYIKNYKL